MMRLQVKLQVKEGFHKNTTRFKYLFRYVRKLKSYKAYNALWMASIWWEAGYQQGRKENTQECCHRLRMNFNFDNFK